MTLLFTLQLIIYGKIYRKKKRKKKRVTIMLPFQYGTRLSSDHNYHGHYVSLVLPLPPISSIEFEFHIYFIIAFEKYLLEC